jgi:hypothetical protein
VDWDRRDRVFLVGAPLAVVPAVALLPVFVLAFLRSPLGLAPWSAARIIALGAACPVLIFVQVVGSTLLGFAGFRARIGYVTVLAMATTMFLLVVAAYTGLFFGIFAGPNG